ncbi:hypothetical protein Tco_0323139, partial [Tanacetum coccineum]
ELIEKQIFGDVHQSSWKALRPTLSRQSTLKAEECRVVAVHVLWMECWLIAVDGWMGRNADIKDGVSVK